MPSPLLFLSDSPDSRSGLGRITRDLCTLTSTLPEFTVASLGRGALCSSRFPWMQYSYPADQQGQWGEAYLQPAWSDFSRKQPGAIMTVWDASRLLWFSRPDFGGLPPHLQNFLGPDRNFSKWGYFPIDSSGPNPDRLPAEAVEILKGYDRVVVASEWAAHITRQSGIACEWIPHGLDLHKFRVADEPTRAYMRDAEGVEGRIVIGSCMTNQARKDYPTLFNAAAIARRQLDPSTLLWLHTDTDVNYWNIYALAADYGVSDMLKVTYTGDFNDLRMAAFYNACDVTVLVSGGEGFGYPIAESLACGTPAITQDYAAGAELTLPEFRFLPLALKVETQHNCLRAVHDAVTVGAKIVEVVEKAREEGHGWRAELAQEVEHLGWSKLKTVWRRWFVEGLEK